MSHDGGGNEFVPHPIQTAGAAQQIAEQLRVGILRGQLRPGDRLPSEADMAAEYSVSRGTIRETMKLLSASQLVESSRGAGVEIVWATTWFTDANLILPLIGIEASWPVLRWLDDKLPAILAAAAGRSFAFADDDISLELRRLSEAGLSLPASPEHLLVDINERRGMTDADLEDLLSFASRNGAGGRRQALAPEFHARPPRKRGNVDLRGLRFVP